MVLTGNGEDLNSLQNIGSSNCSMLQNPLEGFLKHWLLGYIPEFLIQEVWDEVSELHS